MKMGEYQFKSFFAPYLEKFISEKRAVGFIYESEEWKRMWIFNTEQSIYISRKVTKTD